MARELANPERSYRKRVPSVRREELRAVACQVFADRGYAKATMSEIAAAAGIRHGSLYHHFPTKDDILVETLDSFWRDLLAAYGEVIESSDDASVALTGLVHVAFDFVTVRTNEVRILYNDWVRLQGMDKYRFSADSGREAEQLWLSVLDRGMREHLFRDDVDMLVYYRTLIGAILSVVRWFRPDGPYDSAALTQRYAAMFLRGLTT